MKLKPEVEERIKSVLTNKVDKDKYTLCHTPRVYYVGDCYVSFKVQTTHNVTFYPFDCEIGFSQFNTFVKLKNQIYGQKEIMEIIKVIHNNLNDEENWESE